MDTTEIKYAVETGYYSYTDPVTVMEFVFVKGGCYEMGDTFGDGQSDEKPVHEVCANDFYMEKYEVTNSQYRKFKSGYDSGIYEGHSLNSEYQPVVNLVGIMQKTLPIYFLRRLARCIDYPAEWEYEAKSGTRSLN